MSNNQVGPTQPIPPVASQPQSSTPASTVAQRFHGAEMLRGSDSAPRSTLFQGRFGRMFRNLPPFPAETDDINPLLALAGTMFEDTAPQPPPGWTSVTPAGPDPLDNPAIPAGYTYLGQFIDHDITFDPSSQLQRQNDPDALVDYRTPRFDLDSVYGAGPDNSPYLYEADGAHLVIGMNGQEEDLPRNTPRLAGERRAIIGDPRNDENLIVSQLQLAFLKYHNKIVDDLAGGAPPSAAVLAQARRVVTWHYQWLVVNDYLRKIVGSRVVDDILSTTQYVIATGLEPSAGAPPPQQAGIPDIRLKFYHWQDEPFMPVEFSAAAYRFGHSMVRPTYTLNASIANLAIFGPAGGSDLRGFRQRPGGWVIEWHHFFNFPDHPDGLQFSRRIDTRLSPGLRTLPGFPDHPSLAERNLLRGKALGLPSGQDIAGAMGIPHDLILTSGDLELQGDQAAAFSDDMPLWYYVLREAEKHTGGTTLGPVGGRIVSEVLIGLLAGDPLSYLNIDPSWVPTAGKFGADTTGTFGMPQLLTHAGMSI